jgi:hypothetical protein
MEINNNNNNDNNHDPSNREGAPLLSGQDPQRQPHSQQQQSQQPHLTDNSYGSTNQQDAMAAYAMAAAQFEASNGDYAAYLQSIQMNQMNQMMPPNQMPYAPYFGAPYGYGAPPTQAQGPGGGGMPAPYYGGPQQQQPYYYNVPPSGGPSPPMMPPLSLPQAAAPPSRVRPPRAARRSSAGKLIPSPTSNTRKTYEPQPLPEAESNSRPTSGIPSMGAIFSNLNIGGDGQPLVKHSHDSGLSGSASSGNGGGGPYGATTTTTARPNKIWTAPLPHKNSYNGSHSHRRSSSDAPLRTRHRRVGSTGSVNNYLDLPPMTKPSHTSGSAPLLGVVGMRSRSFSAGGMPRRHRRSDSQTSLMSNASGVGSVVSNIAKSSLFGGVHAETGQVQLHFPYENIRLITTTGGYDRYFEHSPDLEAGHLYMQGGDPDEDPFHHVAFEEYHRISTDMAQGQAEHWESLVDSEKETTSQIYMPCCTCTCSNCNGCTGKQQLLPKPQYVLAIKEDVYKRVLSEIAEAQTMPLGLFFCGHHEDVAYPSIVIAVIVVSILFIGMATIAYYGGMTS